MYIHLYMYKHYTVISKIDRVEWKRACESDIVENTMDKDSWLYVQAENASSIALRFGCNHTPT
jgi:hypothetical protein